MTDFFSVGVDMRYISHHLGLHWASSGWFVINPAFRYRYATRSLVHWRMHIARGTDPVHVCVLFYV